MYPHILGCSTFLSAFLKIFGEHVMVAAVINVILTCLSGLLIYSICLRLASPLTAALAYLLWIVCPSKMMLNPLVFSEPLYTCLILLFFYLIVLIEQQRGSLPRRLGVCLLWGLALGVLLRAVNIVRPISAILIIALVLWLLFLRGHDIKDGAQWKMWLVILVALLGIYKATGSCGTGTLKTCSAWSPRPSRYITYTSVLMKRRRGSGAQRTWICCSPI